MATVRISDDVNARLKTAAAARKTSVTKLVEQAVNELLDGPAPTSRAELVAGARAHASRGARARTPASCPHPIGRRLDGYCMVCGAKVSD